MATVSLKALVPNRGPQGQPGLQFDAYKTVSTSTYTLIVGDVRKLLKFTHASGCTITVPAGVFATGDVVCMRGTVGLLTVLEGAGMTVESPAGFGSRAVHSVIGLDFETSSLATLAGDLA